MAKSKGGRPKRVLSEEETAQVEALSSVLNQTQLADYLGVSHTTFIEICKRQESVSLAYKKGRARAIGKIGQTLLKQALDGNTSAMMFYLKTQAGWRETTVHLNENIDVKEFSEMYGEPES